MTTNLALPQDDRQLCHAEALCTLLARADLSDVCTWTVHASGIEGQLSAVNRDPEAHDRLRELADLLTSGRLATQPRPGHTSLEAVGTVEGSPVRFWTHIHDRDLLMGEVRR